MRLNKNHAQNLISLIKASSVRMMRSHGTDHPWMVEASMGIKGVLYKYRAIKRQAGGV